MNERRRRILIDPFQTALVVRIAMYCFVYQVAAWALVALFELVDVALVAMGSDWTLFSNTLTRTLVAMLILVPPLTVDAIRFAHRLVGPLVQFRRAVRAIGAGEPVRLIQLREKDMLMDFKDEFNAMLLHLEQQGAIVLQTPGVTGKAVTPQPADSVTPAAATPAPADAAAVKTAPMETAPLN